MQRIESGRLRGRRLLPLPEGVSGLRPTGARVRGAIFDRLGAAVQGAWVLDLFAGSGALSIEALSRGAEHATLVERDARVARHLALQIDALDLAAATRVVRRDALEWVERESPPRPYDLVLIDPPFAHPEVIEPLARALVRGWLAAHAIVVCERERVRGKSLPVVWPSPLVLEASRTYGQAEVEFLHAGLPTDGLRNEPSP